VRLKWLVRARSNLGPNHLDLVAAIASISIVGSLRYLPYGDIIWATINFAGSHERCFQKSTGRLGSLGQATTPMTIFCFM
jgi:hypothetical protein